jgi:phosphoribosylformimino-5-aminoimidazole carboxamide ribonucleotide (ProFAR) isomerase
VEGSETIEAAEAIRRLSDVGLTTFEVTAIERDGLLGGPDLALYERLVAPGAGTVIASGGIATIDDLRAVQDLGCAGGIVGRALLDGSMDLRDAIGLMATRQDPRGGLV